MIKLTFAFDIPYDEVEIHGEAYRLYYDDESLEKYQRLANKYQVEAQKFLKRQEDIPNMSNEEVEKLQDDGMKFIEDFVEGFYGSGSYTKLYEQSGKAMINFMTLVEFTLEWLQGKVPSVEREKRNYYVGNKKK